jgi:DNA mismatch repair protein MutS
VTDKPEELSIPAAGAGALSPMMRQYRALKQRYPDYILLFRLGDFYEMFFEDAHLGASLLQIALTSRQKGEGAIPMAGIPHHAADNYIARLIRSGQKVAICEQMETPGRGQKLVRREVVRVVTPGTLTDTQFLDGAADNFLLAVHQGPGALGLALVDVSTGEFLMGEADGRGEALLGAALLRRPAEILLAHGGDAGLAQRVQNLGIPVTRVEADWFGLRRARSALCAHFRVASLDAFGVDRMATGLQAAGAALEYLRDTQGDRLGHMAGLARFDAGDALVLDETAVTTLELFQTAQDRTRRGSLLAALDATRTPMGARLLRQWMLRPSLDLELIARRQEAVEALVEAPAVRAAARERLTQVGDVERLASRAALGVAHARDLIALRGFLQALPGLRDGLSSIAAGAAPLIDGLRAAIDPPVELGRLLDEALEDDPPRELTGGGLIRSGWSADLRALREAAREGRAWIASLEARERQRTGIATLRVRFNRVFGYAIEVSNTHAARVPGEYVRRQTLAGAERYVTPELKDYEGRVLGAEERIARLEYELFDEVRSAVADHAPGLIAIGRAVGGLDALLGLAQVAHDRGYVRPTVDAGRAIEIVEGRHPVLDRAGERPFTPNDLRLDPGDTQIAILTGPNMSGKSVYMRQTALLVVMAQMGSFIPARRARIGLVDRVLTRVGAQDNVARGQSTFLVEMVETASILQNATPRSLILLDEVGRGTSTFDGLAIAWAVTEELHDRGRGAKVLFATHYHELTALADRLPRVCNFHVAVKEWNDEIVFLHTVRPGGTDRSYGIQVARLAGLPAAVIARAREILGELASERVDLSRSLEGPGRTSGQLTLFPPAHDPILKDLAALDIGSTTPLEALNLVADWQRQLRERP